MSLRRSTSSIFSYIIPIVSLVSKAFNYPQSDNRCEHSLPTAQYNIRYAAIPTTTRLSNRIPLQQTKKEIATTQNRAMIFASKSLSDMDIASSNKVQTTGPTNLDLSRACD
ncbi:hypothetical protein K458DRAFT_82606 [Lentithecium fluviatile CBS 122367]|uniref:Uncharacterized protein n=1 Tax=Lentithecium fluviatile CBS 122367 TaxID=1168545 RepID=A0A6G1IT11_9PLEO|nr:hypothetical protein K458DRAFT_82606 [Lentithecium fluviatile CBS 122367]